MDNAAGIQATPNPTGTTTIPGGQPRGATYGSGVSATRPSDEYLNGPSVNPYLEAARDFFHQLNESRGDIEPEDRFVDQKYERRNAGNRGREYIRSPYRRQRSYEYNGDDSSYSPGPYREGPQEDTRYNMTGGREDFRLESEGPNSVAGRNPRYSPQPWDLSGQSRVGRDGEGGGRHVSGNRTYMPETRASRMGSPGRRHAREDANFDVQPSSASVHPGAAQHYQMKTTACPTCGGVSYHTHGQYVYSPPSAAVQPPLVVAPPVAVQPPLSAPVVQPTVAAPPMNIVGTFVPGRPSTPSATFTPATWSQTQAVGGGQPATFVLATPPNGQPATPK